MHFSTLSIDTVFGAPEVLIKISCGFVRPITFWLGQWHAIVKERKKREGKKFSYCFFINVIPYKILEWTRMQSILAPWRNV